jgi:exodeoxyribonuclease VII large subunit
MDVMMQNEALVFSPTDFVAVLNQTLDYAYPIVSIEGEIANFRISKNKWVYFDIKDDTASIKCFATIYQLPGPLEDGLKVRLSANPRLHPLYNFSLTVQSIVPVGEGSIKRAADLLYEKLAKEGLFAVERKRAIPFAPEHIVLIASKESAAFADFMKILNERWVGVSITHVDVQVQGERAVSDIVQAIEWANVHGKNVELIIITRGGGSADDLAAFNTEQITRAVALSRLPTLVAIGHEVDFSLAELAADLRASTPSNAAQLITPDKKQLQESYPSLRKQLRGQIDTLIRINFESLQQRKKQLVGSITTSVTRAEQQLYQKQTLLALLNPQSALKRGYALVKKQDAKTVIRSIKQVVPNDLLSITFSDGTIEATVNKVQ